MSNKKKRCNNETYLNHYVPRCYLRKFGDGDLIYCKDKQNEKLFETDVGNICAQKNLYTIKDGSSEEERQLIENFYSNFFDKKYNGVYETLINPHKTSISKHEKYLIIATAITMLARNVKVHNIVNSLIGRALEKAYKSSKASGVEHFVFFGEKILLNKDLKEIKKAFKSEGEDHAPLMKLALKLIDLRQNDRIKVIKIESKQHCFITSDNPVVLYKYNPNSGIIAPMDISNEISLPLDRSHILYIYPNDRRVNNNSIERITYKGVLAKNEVITSNKLQLNNAIRFNIGDKSSLIEFEKLKSAGYANFSISERQELELIQKKILNNN